MSGQKHSAQDTPNASERGTGAVTDWVVAQLKPNSLAIALRNLHRQGFETFLPTREETARRGTRHVTREAPLFPGYVFVRLGNAASLHTVNGTFGVRRLIADSSGRPGQVPPSFMETLLRTCEPDGRLATAPRLATGDRVRVVSGPMVDRIAEVAALPGPQRVMVLLELMGRSVTANLPAMSLVPDEEAPRRLSNRNPQRRMTV